MSGLTPPDIRATIRKILDRLDRLERRLANLTKIRRIVDVPFTLRGGVIVSESQRYYPAEPGGVVVEVLASLTAAGSTSTVVEVRRNGNVVATITFAAGEMFKLDRTLRIDVTGNQDYLTVAVTTAGTDAEGLDVQLRVKVSG